MWLESQGQLPDLQLEVFSALATSLEDFHSRLDWPSPRAPPCCLGVLLAVVLPAVWPVFSNLAALIFRRVCEGSPSLLVVLILIS